MALTADCPDPVSGSKNRPIGLASSPELDHPVRMDVMSTLAEILVEPSQRERASVIYREALDLCIRRSGGARLHLGRTHWRTSPQGAPPFAGSTFW
jgi:hypothetical protein